MRGCWLRGRSLVQAQVKPFRGFLPHFVEKPALCSNGKHRIAARVRLAFLASYGPRHACVLGEPTGEPLRVWFQEKISIFCYFLILNWTFIL